MSDLAVALILPGFVALCLLVAIPFGLLEPPLARWLVLWHGEGEPHQAQFYRCQGCKGVVTHAMIRASGGCRCRLPGCGKVNPTALRLREKAGVLCAPWAYSPWPKRV